MEMSKPMPPGSAAALVPAARADLCLEFANTLSWRGSTPSSETLHGLEDVLAWCASTGALNAASIRALDAWWRDRPAKAEAAFGEVIELRETIFRLFSAAASGVMPSPRDLGRLNQALAQAPKRAQLRRVDDAYVWVETLKPTVPALLAPVLWSAGDLLAGRQVQRVRQCANEKCLWLFLDDSKSGTRRWCSMSSCGNRAKAHRHYIRQKKH